MKNPEIDPQIEQEIAAIAEAEGCELYHLELKGGMLRIYLDRPEGGVTLRDCEKVSRQTSALLDVVEFSDQPYTLEVSSPGLDRQLHRLRDYQRFSGQRVKVTYRNGDGSRRTVVGQLATVRPAAGLASETGEIEINEPGREAETVIPLDRIEVARLEIEL